MIWDATAPFVYARIMGTSEDEPLGYSGAGLDTWAGRAKALAVGAAPEGLPLLVPAEAGDREVFLYVISGAKVRNPAAAMALLERV